MNKEKEYPSVPDRRLLNLEMGGVSDEVMKGNMIGINKLAPYYDSDISTSYYTLNTASQLRLTDLTHYDYEFIRIPTSHKFFIVFGFQYDSNYSTLVLEGKNVLYLKCEYKDDKPRFNEYRFYVKVVDKYEGNTIIEEIKYVHTFQNTYYALEQEKIKINHE